MTVNDPGVALPAPADLSASEVFVQTQGTMILIGSGFGWMIGGLSALGDIPLTLFLAVLAVAALLLLSGWAVRRSASGIAELPWSPQRSRIFGLAFAGEAFGIVAIVSGALLLHRTAWIPPLVALAVGLHFLPYLGR